MISFSLAPPLTTISESIQPMVPSLGVKTLRSGPPWSLTRASVPRLPVAIQASPVLSLAMVSVAWLASVRMFGLSRVRASLALAISSGVMLYGVLRSGELAHVGHDLDRLVLDDHSLLVLRVEQDLPRIRRRRDLGRVVVDLDGRPAERIAEVALRLRPDRERPGDRVELLGDRQRVDVPGLGQPGLEVVGDPQRVARHHVELPADLLELGVRVDVVAEQRAVGLDVVRGWRSRRAGPGTSGRPRSSS